MGPAREWRLFLCAVSFLTRLPTPALREFEPGWIGRSARWFSLVGQVVGVLAAAVFLPATVFLPAADFFFTGASAVRRDATAGSAGRGGLPAG